MHDFTFTMPAGIRYGIGMHEQLGTMLMDEMQFQKVFILTGRHVARSGIIEKITTRLAEAGLEYQIFAEAVPEPAVEDIDRIVGILRASGADGNDIQARADMALASTLAGVAFMNGGLGIVHGISQTMGAIKKKSMIPILSVTVFLCIIIGMICHDVTFANGLAAAYGGFTIPYVGGFAEGYEASAFLTKILVRGGATAQTGIVITCFAGFGCAAMISRGGYLDVALHGLVGNIKSRVGCVIAALLTNLVIMIATGTAYVAFIMVTEMYEKTFLKNRVGMPVLSRCLEDVGTCFGCLIPWPHWHKKEFADFKIKETHSPKGRKTSARGLCVFLLFEISGRVGRAYGSSRACALLA